MNGKCAKRIRLAYFCCLANSLRDVTYTQLKQEYVALPYHKRRIPGVRVSGHSRRIKERLEAIALHAARRRAIPREGLASLP